MFSPSHHQLLRSLRFLLWQPASLRWRSGAQHGTRNTRLILQFTIYNLQFAICNPSAIADRLFLQRVKGGTLSPAECALALWSVPLQVAFGVKRFLQGWIINTLAVLVAVYLVSGIHYERPLDLAVASLVLGILNAVIRPFLFFLALPLLIFTLGLFTLIINALLLYFVGKILYPHFHIDSFLAAFWGALIISVISLILNTLTGAGNSRLDIRRQHRSRSPGSGPNDGGPVIDV